MPEFPRYQSKGQLTSEQPSVQAAEDTTGQMVQEVGKFGNTVQDVSVKWANAVDTIQKTTARANFKSGLLDITNRAQNDPNYNNSEQYFSEIEKLKRNSLKGFSSKTAEIETAIEFDYEQKVAQIQIDNLYKKKMIDVGQASTMKLLDLEASSAAPDLEGRINAVLGPQIQAGIIGHEYAYKLQQEYIKKGKNNSFFSDMNTDLAVAEENLSKNTYGFDVKELRYAKSIYESESAKIRATTENELLGAYLNGEDISVDSVKELMNQKKIDAGFADSMIKKLTDHRPSPLSQDATYIEFQNRESELNNKGNKVTYAEVTKFLSDVMKAHANGLIDKDDTQRAIKNWGPKLAEGIEVSAEKVMEKVRPKKFLERISFWTDEYAEEKVEIKARMYRRLVDGLTQGQDGDVLLARIIDDEIDTKLSNNLKSPDRQYAVNPDTKQRLYSDDGGVTWFDEKTGKEVK